MRVNDEQVALRRELGLTLKQLAAKCGLSDAYLSRVENHKSAVNIANLSNIALALGVPIAVCRSGQGQKVKLRSDNGLVLEMLAADSPCDRTVRPVTPVLWLIFTVIDRS